MSLTSIRRILDEFRSLRWAPLQPKFLDYENAQFLLIGSSTEDLGQATEQQPKDEKADKDTPLEEMEKLEDEDTARVEHLKGMNSAIKTDVILGRRIQSQTRG